MMHIIDDFEKKPMGHDVKSEETSMLPCGTTIKIYDIKSVHDLVQFIGYAKYKNRSAGNVYFRGQTENYNSMIPSLFRNVTSYDKVVNRYNKQINQVLQIPAFGNYDRTIFDPLIQHYGIKTPYIDLVDNIWVALWFAVHEATSINIKSRQYVYYSNNQKEYSYIILMLSDAVIETSRCGVYKGKETTLVDLRKATPSFFLRPHAQHAFMIRKNEPAPHDYSDLIVGMVRIPTKTGLEWLGSNEFLTLRSLFPAVNFDSGYLQLIKSFPEWDSGKIGEYGTIQILSD